MDFLLFKKSAACNFAIFGECKGSFSNPAFVIRELEERKNHIEQNKEYIITNYLNLSASEKVHFEYVIAVPDKDAARMQSCILDNGRDFILWQTSLTGKTGISCIFPPKSLEPRENMMHMDPSLRKMFDGSKQITCSISVGIGYFPQSYEFNRISILLRAAVFNASDRSERIVSKANLKAIIEKDLFYMDQSFKSSQINYIVSKGLEIGFLVKSDGAEDEYFKIATNPQRSDSLERHLKAKWIKHKLEKESERRENEAIMEIRKKFENERIQKTLFDF